MRRCSWLMSLLLVGCVTPSTGSAPASGTGPEVVAGPSWDGTLSSKFVPASPSVGPADSASSASPSRFPTAGPVPLSPVPTTLDPDLTTGRNAIAFAPLSDPSNVVVLGEVASSRAWSTSKVLVVCAYIHELADGDPDRLDARQSGLIDQALSASDLNALLTLRGEIPGGSGRLMTAILRSIGDTTTAAPDRREGSMVWTVDQQVRFMAALHHGKVVSPKASAYVLKHLRPIASQSWGLGTIGASAYKGGWLTKTSETRQMGIVDGYAVAIITNGVGPAELQSDGDWAHVQQLNKLARIAKEAIARR